MATVYLPVQETIPGMTSAERAEAIEQRVCGDLVRPGGLTGRRHPRDVRKPAADLQWHGGHYQERKARIGL